MFFAYFFLNGIDPQRTLQTLFHHCASGSVRSQEIFFIIVGSRQTTAAAIILRETILALFLVIYGNIGKSFGDGRIEFSGQNVSDLISFLPNELMTWINITDGRHGKIAASCRTAG